jgi:hypothetical protein
MKPGEGMQGQPKVKQCPIHHLVARQKCDIQSSCWVSLFMGGGQPTVTGPSRIAREGHRLKYS